MNIKQAINSRLKGHYQDAAILLSTSEWAVQEILNNKGLVSLDDLQKLFDFLKINLNCDDKYEVKYELTTEVNNKIFKNYAGYWLEKKKYEVRESTYANYTNLFVNNIIPCLGNVPCDQFNNKLLQMFAYWCHDKGGKDGKGISEHYIKDSLLLIKAVIRDGQEEGIFPEFTFKQIKIPKKLQIETSKQIYTESEYKKIINYILKNISSKSVGILLGIFTGMRIGEICALQFKDIDFDEKIIHVNKTVQRIYNPLDELEPSKIVITPGKTKNSIRDIPITDEMIKILKTIKKEAGYYVLSNSTKPIEPRTYRKFYNKFMKEAGVEPIKFHALRHTFASINIENGTDVKTISDILGHSDIAITLKTYTHTTQKAKAKAIQRFNDMFKNQEEKINFTSKYKGSICCINKHNNKCDFIGTIKEVAEYIAENTSYVCDVINGIKIDDTYDIVPKIEGITHKNGIYMGVL